MTDLEVQRHPRYDSEISSGFHYDSVSSGVIEVDDPWVWETEMQEDGFYKVSASIRKISGDLHAVQLGVGTDIQSFWTTDTQVSGIVLYNSQFSPSPTVSAAVIMTIGGASAVVEVSAHVYRWS